MKNLTLQPPEQARYEHLKQGIRDGMAICYIVGSYLREIKEREFYRADGYASFEEFCDAEFGYAKRHVRRLILDANTVNTLPTPMRKLLTSHRLIEELSHIPEALRAAAVEVASDGGKKPITREALKSAAPQRVINVKASVRETPPPRPAKKGSQAPPRPQKLKQTSGIEDSTGIDVPLESVELWRRGSEVQELSTYLASVRATLTKAREDKDPLFVEVDLTNNIALLSQVYTDIRRAFPHAVCPSCQGKMAKDCATCKGRGFVSEFYWKTFVPEETKRLRKSK